MPRTVTILGAGLVGSLLAIILRKRGYDVTIYERRPDMRKTAIGAGRSINLAMSERGWRALDLAGLRDEITPLAIPMKGRFLHQADGSTAFQPYGKNGEAIYSVSRGELNKRLMTLAEKEGAVIHFGQRVSHVDVNVNKIYLEEADPNLANAPSNTQSEIRNPKSEIQADLLFGADGAFSALRTAYSHQDRVSARQDYIDYGYKELSIEPGNPGSDNSESRISNSESVDGASSSNPESEIRNPKSLWRMEREALHIWPRGKFMMIALPNPDGSFTCTLFAPFEGESSFGALTTCGDVNEFFQKNFADVLPLMPDYEDQFFRNPVASLITTHISKWHYGKASALIGDAAHAIVPFYGQGMNAGFEDCTVLDGLIGQHGEDWTTIMQEYQRIRKPAGDAVAQLALNNFVEMRDKVADPKFLERKKLEKELGTKYPEQFASVYEMVSFSHTPYHTALKCTEAQDTLLEKIMKSPVADQVTDEPAYEKAVQEWMDEYHKTVKNLDFGK